MKVTVISIGSPRGALADAIRDYEIRIPRYFKFESIEVRGHKAARNADPRSIIEKESAALRARVPPGLEVVALDERGTTWSSEELAQYLEELALRGRDGVAFLIGGASGLAETLRSASDRVLSLSNFTLPHEMARLVLTEQLYRAGTIMRGEPYHRTG